MNKLRIATRTSPLALAQTRWVEQQLKQHNPKLNIDIIGIKTLGDKDVTSSLQKIGGKNLFIKELQQALINHDADCAVHCVKDMSVFPHPDLCLTTICERADPHDVLISHQSLDTLSSSITIGTSSPRRQCLIQRFYPNCQIALCRGNINSRLEKLKQHQYDAILLAQAGLNRLNITPRHCHALPMDDFIPAIGQGALGIECRHDDLATQTQLRPLHHTPTASCIMAERAVNRVLNGDCFSAIAAYASLDKETLQLKAMVGSLTDHTQLRASAQGPASSPEQLGEQVANQLIDQGALDLLNHH